MDDRIDEIRKRCDAGRAGKPYISYHEDVPYLLDVIKQYKKALEHACEEIAFSNSLYQHLGADYEDGFPQYWLDRAKK